MLRIGCIGLSLITEHITPPLAAARYGTKSSVQPCFPLAVQRWAVVQASLVRPADQPSNVSGGREESGPPTVLCFITSEETFLHGWALPHWALSFLAAHPTVLQLGEL